MKFTPEKFTPVAIATLAFTRVGSIAFGYFKAQMSPPIPNLEQVKKIEQSYTIRCQKGECEYKNTTSL
ncbi:MAG: hypothetical protein ICV80_06075 [Microcoleus sp. T1-bin1]|nr:hypothetical protein [Microcoleus sp. T1-bin1]